MPLFFVYKSVAMYNDRTQPFVGHGKLFGGILIGFYYFWSNVIHMARNGIHNTWQRLSEKSEVQNRVPKME